MVYGKQGVCYFKEEKSVWEKECRVILLFFWNKRGTVAESVPCTKTITKSRAILFKYNQTVKESLEARSPSYDLNKPDGEGVL